MSAWAIRPARADESDAVADLHAASWRSAYRGILPNEALGAGVARRRFVRRAVRGRGAMIARVLAVVILLLPAMAAAQDLQLPNGLVLPLPPGAAALQVADGFEIRDPASLGRRVVDTLVVRLLPGAGPSAAGAALRRIDGRAVRYRRAVSAGGSGGEHHTSTAWFSARGGHVLVEAATRAEPPALPDFARAWRLVADLVARNP